MPRFRKMAEEAGRVAVGDLGRCIGGFGRIAA